MVGGSADNSAAGAAWIYTRSGGVWSQQAPKLVGTGTVGQARQGQSVSLSADGNTAIVGGPNDNSNAGAVWVYTRSGSAWTQQGSKLVGTGALGGSVEQGVSVALSGDGNTAIVGGPADSSVGGAAWVFAQPVPSLQVTPITNIAASGTQGGPFAPASFSYTLSATFGNVNYSISGVPNWLTASSTSGTASTGITVTFTVNASANSLAPGTYGPTTITFTNTDTGQGTTSVTATVTVNPPALQVTPTTNIAASGTQGGPFSPSSFSYTLSVASGGVNYSISNVPAWLTPSSTSGTATSSPTTVTFTVNANPNSLTPNTYVNSISFNNTTNGQGNTTRVATLTVNPQPVLQVTPATNMVASGTQGGPFSPLSFQYQLSASVGSVNYSISGLPNWLTASPASGNVSPSGTTVIFTVNANSLAAGTYGPIPITFYHFYQLRHRPGYPDPNGNADCQSAALASAASNAHCQYLRRRKSRRARCLFIPIRTQCEHRHRQLFDFGRPELAHPIFNLGHCFDFGNGRNFYGECKREQPCPRHIRSNRYHFHEHRHRPRHPNPDGNADGESASAAGDAYHGRNRFGDTRRSILAVVIHLRTQRH
jgi:hypothetical protein